MPVLRGLEGRIARESTPIHDQLMARVGSLFDENPWNATSLDMPAWDLPADYELPPMPLFMALPRMQRLISSRFDTQMMEVIS
jgi:hypothetical protein